MTKKLSMLAAVAALVVPAIALADEPSAQNKENAAKECKALRTASGKENFRSMFGGGKNAYGKCVSQHAKKDQKQEKQAKANASKDCDAEQAQDPVAFKDKYGTGKDGKNAHGKCVSQKAKENKAEADKTDKNDATAAKQCKSEKSEDADAFKQKYGTNENKKNAFGKCVSQKSHELDQQDAEQSDGSTA
ncbi:MAG: hypothetical protein QOG41_893 [Thermoleophilaceae bacterium]|jgi:hypothetical protein|nr:hypothetical protein [Thermoleophilaceae bacterium]MEA2388120.1 hypothetical protein [Thermoleophilaceae bacterium]